MCATAATQSGCESTSVPSRRGCSVANADLAAGPVGVRQLGRVRAELRRCGVRIAGLRAGEHVEHRGGVAHRARDDVLADEAAVARRRGRRERHAAAARLEPVEAAAARGDPDRAAAVVRVRDRDEAGRDRGDAEPPLEPPVERVVSYGLRAAATRAARPTAGCRAPTCWSCRRSTKPARLRSAATRWLSCVYAEVRLLERQEPRRVERAADGGADVLDQDRHAAERAVRQRVSAARRAPASNSGMMTAPSSGVVLLDPGDREVDELARRAPRRSARAPHSAVASRSETHASRRGAVTRPRPARAVDGRGA